MARSKNIYYNPEAIKLDKKLIQEIVRALEGKREKEAIIKHLKALLKNKERRIWMNLDNSTLSPNLIRE